MNRSTNKSLIALILFLSLSFFCEAQSTPPSIDGLIFWLRSDSGVVVEANNKVSQWQDLSGQDHHAIQTFDYLRPNYITDNINEKPAISFDGVDDFMSFPEVSSIRTVFWVVKENPLADPNNPRRSLLGHSSTFYFLRGPDRTMWDPFGNANTVNGSTRLNGASVNGLTTPIPYDYSIIDLTTTGNVAATHLTMDLNIFGRTWWGEIVEIIAYNEVLNLQQIESIETYLANRYTPDLPESLVINAVDLCDTTYCFNDEFVNVVWDGTTASSCQTFSQNGEGTVTVTDEFNRTVTISYVVVFPTDYVVEAITPQCTNDPIVFNTSLDNTYTHTWNGSVGDASYIVNENTIVALNIEQFGCDQSYSLSLTYSEIAHLNDWLSSSLTVCEGETFSLDLPTSVDVEWSNGFSGNQTTLTENGNLTVTLSDDFGCEKTALTTVTIQGISPILSITSEGICTHQPVNISATADQPISTWTWTLDNGNVLTGPFIDPIWNSTGEHSVELVAVSESGCSATMNYFITLFDVQDATVNVSEVCQNEEFILSIDQNLNDISWISTIDTWQGNNLITTIDASGTFELNVTYTDENNCTATIDHILQVKPQPNISFASTNHCFGNLTEFTSSYTANGAGPVDSFAWTFGDNTSSQQPHPTHFYPGSGFYAVHVLVVAQNGCTDEYNTTVHIVSSPQLQVNTAHLCTEVPTAIDVDLTFSSGDGFSSVLWQIEGYPDLDFVGPTITASSLDPLDYFIEIHSQEGCVVTQEGFFEVHPTPTAHFSYYPQYGQENGIVFTNLSTGENLLFEWTSSDWGTASSADWMHTFPSEGSFEVTLNAISLYGCSATETDNITVEQAFADLAVESIAIVEGNFGQVVEMTVKNMGNMPIIEYLSSWQGGGEMTVSEPQDEYLVPGESYTFQFSGSFDPDNFTYDYLCGQSTPLAYVDMNPDNNTACIDISDQRFVVYPPYPNPGDTHIFLRCTTAYHGDLQILVRDADGRLLKELVDGNVPVGFHQYFIDIRDLSTGTYILECKLGESQRIVRFIKN